MQFFLLNDKYQTISQYSVGYLMQYSDGVEIVFCGFTNGTETKPTDEVAQLIGRPNGATNSVETIDLVWSSFTFRGKEYWGWKTARGLPARFTQIQGNLALNLVITKGEEVIYSTTFGILVNKSATETQWIESIGYAEWEELVSYFLNASNIKDYAVRDEANTFTKANTFRDNVFVLEPTEDNNPATKKFVENSIKGIDTSDFAKLSKTNNFAEDVVFQKNLTVNGTFTKVNAETISTKEYTIGLAKGNTTPIASYVGLYAEKYDGTNDGALVWDNTGTAYVGDVTIDENGKVADGSNLQPLLTRGEATSLTDKAMLFWSADGSKATQGKDSSGTVYTLGYLADIVGKFGDYLPLSGGTASGDIASTNGTNDTTLSHNGVISHVDGYQHDVRFSSQGIWATDNDFAYSFAYGVTGTIAYADTADNANLTLYAKKTELPSTANCVKYVTNTVDVGGTEKAVSKVSPSNLFVPSGLVIGGSAQQAGLMTRGISGSTAPVGSSGACSKDTLYVNYDGENTYKRGLALGAGGEGAPITVSTAKSTGPSSPMGRAFTAIRGDQMVNYVRDYVDIKFNDCLKTSGNQTATGVKSFTDGIDVDTINSKATGNSMLRMFYETASKLYRVLVGSVLRPLTLLGNGDRPYYAKDGEGFEQKGIALLNDLDTKQDKLVSGTNIKTIDGEDILGEGDLSITGKINEIVTNVIVNTVFPIGTIVMTTSSKSPGFYYPNTTWERIEGRFIVGASPTTYVVGTTGGSTTHDHDLNGANARANVGITLDGRIACANNSAQGSSQKNGRSVATGNTPYVANDWAIAYTATLEGNTTTANNVQPYYAAYIWRRTA